MGSWGVGTSLASELDEEAILNVRVPGAWQVGLSDSSRRLGHARAIPMRRDVLRVDGGGRVRFAFPCETLGGGLGAGWRLMARRMGGVCGGAFR